MNKDNLLCQYSESIVPYLYDELPARELAIFEAHLGGCTSCTDEFASVADTRFSVYEWHKEAFVPLATPRFVRPFEQEVAEPAGIFSAIASLVSWSRPAFAMAGVAVVVLLGLIAISLTPTDDRQVAANVEIPPPVTETPTQATLPQTPAITAPPVAPVTAAFTPAKASIKPRIADRSTPKAPTNRQRDIQLRQANRAPVLTDNIDIEDDSLRLTDLFEQVGG